MGGRGQTPVLAKALRTKKEKKKKEKRRTRVHRSESTALSHRGLPKVKSEGSREADSGLDNF